MILFPYKSETLVLPHHYGEIMAKIRDNTRPLRVINAPTVSASKSSYLFNGWMGDREFKISKTINTPQNFLPLITGRFESTSMGCILFVKYRLFASTFLFLTFIAIICFLMALLFFIAYQKYFLGIVSIGFAVVNHVVAILNFNIQYKKSRNALMEILQND